MKDEVSSIEWSCFAKHCNSKKNQPVKINFWTEDGSTTVLKQVYKLEKYEKFSKAFIWKEDMGGTWKNKIMQKVKTGIKKPERHEIPTKLTSNDSKWSIQSKNYLYICRWISSEEQRFGV